MIKYGVKGIKNKMIAVIVNQKRAAWNKGRIGNVDMDIGKPGFAEIGMSCRGGDDNNIALPVRGSSPLKENWPEPLVQ